MADDIFIPGCQTEFFETVNGIANLHSFVLSKPKITSMVNGSMADERKMAVDLGLSANNDVNVWYGSCKYPNFG